MGASGGNSDNNTEFIGFTSSLGECWILGGTMNSPLSLCPGRLDAKSLLAKYRLQAWGWDGLPCSGEPACLQSPALLCAAQSWGK